MMGTPVYNDNVYVGQTKRVSMINQPAGIYLLKIIGDNGQVITEKVIKK